MKTANYLSGSTLGHPRSLKVIAAESNHKKDKRLQYHSTRLLSRDGGEHMIASDVRVFVRAKPLPHA